MSQTPDPTTATSEVQRELASRILSRRRLLPFIERLNPRYLAGWVHEDICRRLEQFSNDVEAGLSPRLMILMPPRHGKSLIASQNFPAWHLGRFPYHEIIASSYNVSLAMTFSRKVKTILEDPAYQSVFDTRLDPGNQSAEEWGIAGNSGGYVAAGVRGGITGKGAHILIIDDPVKSAEEADSSVTREAIKDWYGSTAYTRLAPGGGVLLIQTCWHDDDLAGWLQSVMKEDPEADQFEIIKYPAIAETDEYIDTDTGEIVYDKPENGTLLRSLGDPLHEARYDLKKLLRIKKTLQPRFWSALYQQNPVPDDGSYFVREQFRNSALIRVKPREHNVMMAWDFAISEKQQNDFTVGSVGLQDTDDMLHVPEIVRFKTSDSFQIVEAMLNLVARWPSKSMVMGVEDGQIWRAISRILYKRMRERRQIFGIEVLKPITDKMSRARVLQGRMQQGMISFNKQTSWYPIVEREMLRFPAGVNDDCVDSLAWLAQLAVGKEPPRALKPKAPPSWKTRLTAKDAGTHMSA